MLLNGACKGVNKECRKGNGEITSSSCQGATLLFAFQRKEQTNETLINHGRPRRSSGLAILPGSVQAARRRVPSPAVKTYQVTGPVLEATNDMIVVQKGKKRREIARDSNTKVTGDLRNGSHVTIQYRMIAASVSGKPLNPPRPLKRKPHLRSRRSPLSENISISEKAGFSFRFMSREVG